MASGCIRSTRKLKQWMIEQVNSGNYPGLTWDDPDKASFRIPWKHAGKQDFRHDEDAAIFKAWAIFKNKFKVGDKMEAAMWKTRLRCALNKSPEFAEVPERSQLDISEPYKVYRLVPTGEQSVKVSSGRGSMKRKLKEESRDLSSEDELDAKRPATSQLMSMDVNQEGRPRASSSFCHEDSGIGSCANSPQSNSDSPQSNSDSPRRSSDSPQRSLDSLNEITLNMVMEAAPDRSSELQPDIYTMQITIFYGGQEVCRKDVQSGDCKISPAPAPLPTRSLPENRMESIFLPSEEIIDDLARREGTKKLLAFLDKGVMLASIPQGIFIQRYCQGRVFWTGPCAPQPGKSNKLEKGVYTQLFNTNQFLKDLDLYQTQHGPAPEHRVMLCFGEEISHTDQKKGKLITVQIEQHWARLQIGVLPYNPSLSQEQQNLAQQLQDAADPFNAPLYQGEQDLAQQLQDEADTFSASLYQGEQNLAQQLQDEAETFNAPLYQGEQNLAQQLQDEAETFNASLSLYMDPDTSPFMLEDVEKPSLLNLG